MGSGNRGQACSASEDVANADAGCSKDIRGQSASLMQTLVEIDALRCARDQMRHGGWAAEVQTGKMGWVDGDRGEWKHLAGRFGGRANRPRLGMPGDPARAFCDGGRRRANGAEGDGDGDGDGDDADADADGDDGADEHEVLAQLQSAALDRSMMGQDCRCGRGGKQESSRPLATPAAASFDRGACGC
nr:hypothetical protein CFP56_02671 [Quercus suber]